MKATFLSSVGLAAIMLVCTATASGDPMGTAFTYQGHLKDAGGAVTADCDFQFSLWNAATDGTQMGSTLSLTKSVDRGLFTVRLDFGDQFNGGERWLQLAVCCPSTCTPEALDQRQELTPNPHSLNADKVDRSHGCTLVKMTGYSETGDFETLSTQPLCGNFPKGCTIRLISTKSTSSGTTADNGEAFGLYNQNWYNTIGGWRVVAMSSSSASVTTAVGANGNGVADPIMSAGSCTLKDDLDATDNDYTTWVVNDNSGTYTCYVYVCD